jgi:hypothetical protein
MKKYQHKIPKYTNNHFLIYICQNRKEQFEGLIVESLNVLIDRLTSLQIDRLTSLQIDKYAD